MGVGGSGVGSGVRGEGGQWGKGGVFGERNINSYKCFMSTYHPHHSPHPTLPPFGPW